MKIGKIDKTELSGLIVLFIGVILLAFTFISAYSFLAGKLGLLGSQNILQAFGEALAPLIEAIIRILYLGIMGWLGSILTIRGVQLLKKERTETPPTQQQQQLIKTEPKQATQKESKPEVKEAKTDVEKQTKAEEAEKTKTPEKTDKPEGAAPSTSNPSP